MTISLKAGLGVMAACIVLVGVSRMMAETPATSPAEEIKILWVGSSSTYFNYMGKQVGDWLTADSGGRTRYITHLVWRDGTLISYYLQPDPAAAKPILGLDKGQTVLDRIRSGGYKFVPLQVVTHLMTHPAEGQNLVASLDVYVKAIRAAGAEPIYYEQGWSNTKEVAEHSKGQKIIFDSAVKNKVTLVAPCASAWDIVRKEKPNLPLQEPSDGAHPGPLGNFLNCCVFYATITGKEPKNMPRTMVFWDHHWRQGYKADVIPPQVTFVTDQNPWKNDPTWQAYIGPFPNDIRGYVGTIDDKTAAYLQDAAWRACRAYKKRLDLALTAHQASRLE